ncbi:MAG: glycosyltransferase family 1 protein [Thermodesulfobacteriota bacterium]
MKIAINALFLVEGKGGGLETCLRGWLAAMSKLDSSSEYLLYTNRACRGAFPLGENFREITCDVSAVERLKKTFYEQTVFPGVIKKEGVDLLYNPGNIAPARHHCPSVTVIHDMVPFIRPEGFNTLELGTLKALFSLTARTSERVITVSEYSKKDMVDRFGISPDKVTVIYNGLDLSMVCANDSDGDDGVKVGGPFILSVASSRKYKNLDGLLRAFKIVKEGGRFPELKLVMAGHAERVHAELVELTDALSISGDVVFTGFVEPAELAQLYKRADLLVYPSFFEGFGLPVLEAFANGTPVAASNAASIPEVVGDAGLLFDPTDTTAIAESVIKILLDPALKEELIKKGLKRAGEFTWERAAAETLNIFKEVSAH